MGIEGIKHIHPDIYEDYVTLQQELKEAHDTIEELLRRWVDDK